MSSAITTCDVKKLLVELRLRKWRTKQILCLARFVLKHEIWYNLTLSWCCVLWIARDVFVTEEKHNCAEGEKTSERKQHCVLTVVWGKVFFEVRAQTQNPCTQVPSRKPNTNYVVVRCSKYVQSFFQRAPIARSGTHKLFGHLSLALGANSEQIWFPVAQIWQLGHRAFGSWGHAKPPWCDHCSCP